MEKVGSRGYVFSYDDLSSEDYYVPTNVYLIDGTNQIFICDTYLGPETMKPVKDFIEKNLDKKPIVVFNSHHHWDHHWGNCFFKGVPIIGHYLCRENINQKGEDELERNKKYHRGEITLTPPNILFSSKIAFPEEDISFFFSPGHTNDSASCFDNKTKILFAADNIEEPIPYMPSSIENIETYQITLKKYLELEPETVIPGHGPISNRELLEENYHYLLHYPEIKEVPENEKRKKMFLEVHLHNLYNNFMHLISNKQKEQAKIYLEHLQEINQQWELGKDKEINKLTMEIK
jgi:glyoxylase-like metal-dependent hydrolase (beta-lactamase superfamily II)